MIYNHPDERDKGSEWVHWFAWFPVKTKEGAVVWFERVWCRKMYNTNGSFHKHQYRLKL